MVRLRDELGLSHWQINFGTEYPENGNAWASIEAIPGKYEATVRLGEGFFELRPAAVRESVIHELLHLYQLRLFHMVRDGGVSEQLSEAAHTMLLHEFKREMEYANDRLTHALEHRLPLPPPWPR